MIFQAKVGYDKHVDCICVNFKPEQYNGGWTPSEEIVIVPILAKHRLIELMEYNYEYHGPLTPSELANALQLDGVTII